MRPAAIVVLALTACSPPADTIVVMGSWETDPAAYSAVVGARLAVDAANGEGGIHGRPIRLVELDDRYGVLEMPEFATDLARRADSIADSPRVLAVVGHTHSIPTAIAASAYGHRKPMLIPGSMPPDVGSAEAGVFSMLDLRAASRALALDLYQRGYRRVSVLFENSPGGRAPVDAFIAAYPGTLVSSDPVLELGASEMEPYLDYFAAREVDAVVHFGGARRGLQFLKSWRGRAASWQPVGMYTWATAASDDSARTLLAGALYSLPFTPAGGGRLEAFLRDYRTRHGRFPDAAAFAAYDAVLAIVEAARAGGLSGPAITEHLGKLRTSASLQGVTGLVYFQPNGERDGAVPVMIEGDAWLQGEVAVP